MALVARQVVDDDDVARRERRHEDLSHVLQEALAINGAVEELGGGHAAQPQPGNERGLRAVPVRDRRAQAHASRRAAVQASHVGAGKALVDEHELRRIEIELGFEPVLTSLHHVGAVLLGSVQGLLLKVRPQRSRKVQIVPVLARTPFSATSRRRSSSMVASGAASITASGKSRWASSLEPGRRPCRRAERSPLSRRRSTHLIAVETPTSKRTAAWRADVPFPVASITLSRKS